MDQLPDPRHEVGGIFGQDTVKESRARTRQPRDKDRPLDRVLPDARNPLFFRVHPQKVRQEPYDIPAGCEPAEEAQIRLFEAGAQQIFEGASERRFAKLGETRASLRGSDQLTGVEWRAQGKERCGDLEGGSLQHRRPFWLCRLNGLRGPKSAEVAA